MVTVNLIRYYGAKRVGSYLRILVGLLACLFWLSGAAEENLVQPTITLGSGSVSHHSLTYIPITLHSPDRFVGLQFDITFEPSLFETVDTSRCFEGLQESGYLTGCRRLDPPNHDLVRFVVFNFGMEPIQSGVIGSLGFQANENSPATETELSGLGCTGLGITTAQEAIYFTSKDFQAGSLIVSGDGPTVEPVPADFLDLEGTPVPYEGRVYRSMQEITNPITVLAEGPNALALVMPDGREKQLLRRAFDPRHGFVLRLDCSDRIVPDGNPDTELSFRWYGELENGGWLGMTVVHDVVSGTLVTGEGSYKIIGSPDNGFRLAEVDQEDLPPSRCLGHGPRVKGLEGRAMDIAHPAAVTSAARTGQIELDILIMYTQQAKIDAGGPSELSALIQESIDNTNQAFVNSGLPNLSVREVHREVLTGFEPSGTEFDDAINDLDQLRLNSQILAARDQHYADITLVLLRNFFNAQNQPQLYSCGIAYLQSPTCGRPGEFPDCGVGADFEDFAINWASVQCANLPGRHTFPHELGHLMGAEHQPGPASQDPSDASYPWSFAHFSSSGPSSQQFGTLMWVPAPTELPQFLNFSNPDVLIQSQPSGIANTRHNARTIDLLAPLMELYRIPPDYLIFQDRFE